MTYEQATVAHLPDRWREFPPVGSGRIGIPSNARSTALAGIGLYAACRPFPLIAQRCAWWTVKLVGARVLPSRRRPALINTDCWSALWNLWERELGRFDDFAVYQRPQRSRSTFGVLLLQDGRSRVFVKVRAQPVDAFANEWDAMQTVARARPTSFAMPTPIVVDEVAGCSFIAMTALEGTIHRPPSRPHLQTILRELSDALRSRADGDDFPSHYEPMHGDFTPWNLRQVSGGKLVLIDWECCSWGPPGADEVLYRALDAVMNRRPTPRTEWIEAAEYWREVILSRLRTSSDHDRGRRTGLALAKMLQEMAR